MGNTSKTDEPLEASKDEEGEAKEAGERWWKTHSSAAVVLLIASLTATLYFLGSRRLSTIAHEFGLAATPRSMGLQEVMMSGAEVIQSVMLVGVIAAWLVLFVGLRIFIWVLEIVVKKGEAVEAASEKVSADFEELRKRPVEELQMDEIEALRRRVKVTRSSAHRFNKLGGMTKGFVRVMSALGIIALSGGVGLFMAAGALSGRLEAGFIRDDVRGSCEGCFRYNRGTVGVVARPIFQADDFMVGLSRQGTVVIPIDGALTIKPYAAGTPRGDEPKKAGPEARTRKPTGTLKPPQAPSSPPAGSPHG